MTSSAPLKYEVSSNFLEKLKLCHTCQSWFTKFNRLQEERKWFHEEDIKWWTSHVKETHEVTAPASSQQ